MTKEVALNAPIELPIRLDWKGEGASRTPYEAYTSEALYRRELDRLTAVARDQVLAEAKPDEPSRL